MAYDPTKPANNSPIVSAELRNQFAGLKGLIDALQTQVNDLPPTDAVLDMITANSAGPCGAFEYPDLTFSDPPTQAEVQALNNKLEAVLTLLKRA